MPAGGSRAPASAETVAERQHFAKMNGREVFKFATRVLVDSAEKVLHECDVQVDEIDVYVPHQANVRIIDHARKKLGIPEEKTVRQRRPLRQHFLWFDSTGARTMRRQTGGWPQVRWF